VEKGNEYTKEDLAVLESKLQEDREKYQKAIDGMVGYKESLEQEFTVNLKTIFTQEEYEMLDSSSPEEYMPLILQKRNEYVESKMQQAEDELNNFENDLIARGRNLEIEKGMLDFFENDKEIDKETFLKFLENDMTRGMVNEVKEKFPQDIKARLHYLKDTHFNKTTPSGSKTSPVSNGVKKPIDIDGMAGATGDIGADGKATDNVDEKYKKINGIGR